MVAAEAGPIEAGFPSVIKGCKKMTQCLKKHKPFSLFLEILTVSLFVWYGISLFMTQMF